MGEKALKRLRTMDFLVFFGFIVFSTIFGLLAYFLSWILRYKTKNNALNSTYECGTEISEDADICFQINFFTYIICFLLFEAECVLMFPFAYMKGVLDIFYVIEIMIFILILILTLIFSIKSNFLKF